MRGWEQDFERVVPRLRTNENKTLREWEYDFKVVRAKLQGWEQDFEAAVARILRVETHFKQGVILCLGIQT